MAGFITSSILVAVELACVKKHRMLHAMKKCTATVATQPAIVMELRKKNLLASSIALTPRRGTVGNTDEYGEIPGPFWPHLRILEKSGE